MNNNVNKYNVNQLREEFRKNLEILRNNNDTKKNVTFGSEADTFSQSQSSENMVSGILRKCRAKLTNVDTLQGKIKNLQNFINDSEK